MDNTNFKIGDELHGGHIIGLHKNFIMVKHKAGYCESYDYPLKPNTEKVDDYMPTMSRAIWNKREEATLKDIFNPDEQNSKQYKKLAKIYDVSPSAIRSKLYRMGLTDNIKTNNKNLMGGTYEN